MIRWLRLRWRLARMIAPVPFMADPCPGREAFVMVRSKPGEYQWAATYPLDTLDITSEIVPFPDDFDLTAYRPSKRLTKITGTAEA